MTFQGSGKIFLFTIGQEKKIDFWTKKSKIKKKIKLDPNSKIHITPKIWKLKLKNWCNGDFLFTELVNKKLIFE